MNTSPNSHEAKIPLPADQQKYLDDLKENLSKNYALAFDLYEQLAFLSELAGQPNEERKIELSEVGTNGLQRLLINMSKQAEEIACSGIYPFQLESLIEKVARHE